jgi:hypothetical protein
MGTRGRNPELYHVSSRGTGSAESLAAQHAEAAEAASALRTLVSARSFDR